MKWEYAMTTFNLRYSKDDLNSMGDLGWELAAIQGDSAYWKRPVDEAPAIDLEKVVRAEIRAYNASQNRVSTRYK